MEAPHRRLQRIYDLFPEVLGAGEIICEETAYFRKRNCAIEFHVKPSRDNAAGLITVFVELDTFGSAEVDVENILRQVEEKLWQALKISDMDRKHRMAMLK